MDVPPGLTRRFASFFRYGRRIDKIMKPKKEHFELARRIVRQWRQVGYDRVVVVRQSAHAEQCYPCQQHDVPQSAVADWDYYPIPTRDRLDERAPAEESASRAELWVAATIADGRKYHLTARAA
jgi:hypothetical protein